MRIARLALAALTVGAWTFLLLQAIGFAPPASPAVLVPLGGTVAAVRVGFFSQPRLSIPAAVVLEILLLAVAGLLNLVVMASSAG